MVRSSTAVARRVVKGRQLARRLRRVATGGVVSAEPMPSFRTAGTARAKPAVRVLCPDWDTPSGGIRTLYRYVEILSADGRDAAVVHHQRGFRCTWFDSPARVLDAAHADLHPGDLLVVPEVYGANLARTPPGVRVLSANQNAYNTFIGGRLEDVGRPSPYADVPGLAGALVVSADNAAYLQFIHPEMSVWVVPPAIDPDVFHPRSQPGRVIGVMPRRRRREAAEVLRMLSVRGALEGWEVRMLHGLTEEQTARALAGCAVFLSFSEREGFGLPPAEAMASGCHVVGFTGLAGREYFDPAYSTPVGEGDVRAFAAAALEALRRVESDPGAARESGLAASVAVLSRYSPQAQRTALLAAVSAAAEG